jgi:hypothetical protein
MSQLNLSSSQMSLGESVDSFPQYKLESRRILFNGEPTDYQHVEYHNESVAIYSKRYHLIPNEDAKKVAEEVKRRTGYVYPSELPAGSIKKMGVIRDIMTDSKNYAVTICLVDPKPKNIGTPEQPDWLHLGGFITNSIDGSRAFSASTFSFRTVCGNGHMNFKRLRSLEVLENEVLRNKHMKSVEQNTLPTVLDSLYQAHSKKFNFAEILERCIKVFESGEDLFRQYQLMKKQTVSEKVAKEMMKMPKMVWETLPWLKTKKVTTRAGTHYEYVSHTPVDNWTALNDVTEVISHQDKLSYGTVIGVNAKASQLLMPKVRAA